MSVLEPCRGRIAVLYYLRKLQRGFYRLPASEFNYIFGYSLRELFLSVIKQYLDYFGCSELVYYIERGEILTSVHPHIQRRVLHIAEPAFGVVKLIARYSEVNQYSVYSADLHNVKVLDEIFEIVVQEADLLSKPAQSFSRNHQRVRVLVNGYKPSVFSKSFGYLARMSRAADRAIHVYSVSLDVKSVYTLLKHYRHVMKFHILNSVSRLCRALP